MAKFRKKPVVIEAITFEEFLEYGRSHSDNIVNGFPWSFEYNGHPITHENDECYLIPTLEGTHNFTPEDMLITGLKGEIYPCKKDIFEKSYEPVYTAGIDPYEKVSKKKLKVEEAMQNLREKINAVKDWDNVDVDQFLNEFRS